MTWEALNNYVTVLVDQPGEVVTGAHGLVVPARPSAFRTTGVVESVGPTCRADGIVKGARVLFPPYGAGHRTRVDGVERVSLLDWEVLGVFR